MLQVLERPAQARVAQRHRAALGPRHALDECQHGKGVVEIVRSCQTFDRDQCRRGQGGNHPGNELPLDRRRGLETWHVPTRDAVAQFERRYELGEGRLMRQVLLEMVEELLHQFG